MNAEIQLIECAQFHQEIYNRNDFLKVPMALLVGNSRASGLTGSFIFLPLCPSPLTQSSVHTCGFWLVLHYWSEKKINMIFKMRHCTHYQNYRKMRNNSFKQVMELCLYSNLLSELSRSFTLILIIEYNAVALEEPSKELNVIHRACKAI